MQAGAALGLPSSAISAAIEPTMTPVALALAAQKGFRSFGVFSHGFLAGLAFWQLIMVRWIRKTDVRNSAFHNSRNLASFFSPKTLA